MWHARASSCCFIMTNFPLASLSLFEYWGCRLSIVPCYLTWQARQSIWRGHKCKKWREKVLSKEKLMHSQCGSVINVSYTSANIGISQQASVIFVDTAWTKIFRECENFKGYITILCPRLTLKGNLEQLRDLKIKSAAAGEKIVSLPFLNNDRWCNRAPLEILLASLMLTPATCQYTGTWLALEMK